MIIVLGTTSWANLHPLVVHFPIALLTTTPLFLILGLLWPKKHQMFNYAALVLMAIGTLSAVLAVETGEAAAANAVAHTPEVGPLLLHHGELAETTRNVYLSLTIIFLLLLLADTHLSPAVNHYPMRWLFAMFLAGYVVNLAFLAQTAEAGGRLVHQYGLHAPLAHDTVSKAFTPAH